MCDGIRLQSSKHPAIDSMSLPQASSPAPPWSRRAREAREVAAAANSSTATAANPSTIPSTISQPVAQRQICLGYNCYENSKRAHWYLYIPSTTDSNIGKVIQVTGNVWDGFGFQIKTNFNIRDTYDHYIHLGYVLPDLIVDDYTPDAYRAADIRSHPIDAIEQVAFDLGLPVQNPEATLPPHDDPVWNLPNRDFERCQEWIGKLVGVLVEKRRYLDPAALSALDNATSFGV